MATRYQVYWDNGNHACGTFEQLFDTRAEAEAFGDAWWNGMAIADPEGKHEYHYEIVEAN